MAVIFPTIRLCEHNEAKLPAVALTLTGGFSMQIVLLTGNPMALDSLLAAKAETIVHGFEGGQAGGTNRLAHSC